MHTLNPPVELPVALFQCTDAQEQAAALPGWNQSYWQLSSGAFFGAVQAASVDGIYVFLESANRALLQRGQLAAGALAVAVPVRLAGPARFCGVPCTLDQAFIYSGRDGFEFCSPAEHQVAGIALAPELVAAVQARGRPLLSQRCGDMAHARAAVPAVVQEIRKLVADLLAALTAAPTLVANQHARSALKEAVVAGVCELFEDQQGQAEPKAKSRTLLVSRARERIEDTPNEPMSVAQLCAALNVSRRTLQSCFQEVLGVSPLVYLRMMRLNGARRALQLGRPVTNVALDWGFWHLGQFSADYRRAFGELPSQTLRNARGLALA